MNNQKKPSSLNESRQPELVNKTAERARITDYALDTLSVGIDLHNKHIAALQSAIAFAPTDIHIEFLNEELQHHVTVWAQMTAAQQRVQKEVNKG